MYMPDYSRILRQTEHIVKCDRHSDIYIQPDVARISYVSTKKKQKKICNNLVMLEFLIFVCVDKVILEYWKFDKILTMNMWVPDSQFYTLSQIITYIREKN